MVINYLLALLLFSNNYFQNIENKLYFQESNNNRIHAEKFLEDNSKQHNVTSLFNNKLQYKIIKEGDNNSICESDTAFVVLKGKYLDGSYFLNDDEPQIIDLTNITKGLSEGLLGMKEKEKRIIYIHPSLCNDSTQIECPNALLIFEIELLEINKKFFHCDLTTPRVIR